VVAKGSAKLTDLNWDDRVASYTAAYKKLSREERASVDDLICLVRERVKGENMHIQLSDGMALAIVGEVCVRSLFPHTQDPVIEEVTK
jgi:hypothetical protein